MIEDLNEYLLGIAIGVRFRPNFSIEDQLGIIADTILYSDNSFFGPTVFPKATPLATSKVLSNETSTDRLVIDHSNVLLEIYFGEGAHFNKEELQDILDNFNDQIIKNILGGFHIREIQRLGYVRRYLFEIETLASNFVEKTIGSTLAGVNDINLNFSKKLATQEALIKEGVADYDNAIFTIIKKAGIDEIFMAIDYQSYYDPFLPMSGVIQFKPFIDKATRFNSTTYRKWLNENYMEGEK